jgi:peptidoglycan/xylan/chitin deacetylase (PgdA/CDA1 family)
MRESSGIKVLMYHWISGSPGGRLRAWGVTPAQFESQMRHLAEEGYRTVSLGDVVELARGVRPPAEKTVALTFDDGYRDFLEYALPVLRRHRFSATVFLVTDHVGGTNAWDARHGDPPRELMGWEEAAELADQGIEIGSHGRTHRFLPSLSGAELEEEIHGSRRILEDRLGRAVRFFSYPHGLHDGRCLTLAASAGYEGACADIRGGNGPGTDPFRLRRTLMTFHDGSWSFSFKLRTGFGAREWAQQKLESFGRATKGAAAEEAYP